MFTNHASTGPETTSRQITRRQILMRSAALAACPNQLWAASSTYRLDPEHTTVGFGFRLNGIWQNGRMPVASSTIVLDPNHLKATQVSVSLDASAAKTGFIFATQAMIGPDVLNTAQFPTISFTSHQILLGPDGRLSGGAEIIGELTLRGVTLPISLKAALYRPLGSAIDDLSRLDFTLTGSLSRRAFGASGFSILVQDQIRLNIKASLQKIE